MPTEGFLQAPLVTKGAFLPGWLSISSRTRGGRLPLASFGERRELKGLATGRSSLRMVLAEDRDLNGGVAAKAKDAMVDQVSALGVVDAEQVGEIATDFDGKSEAGQKIVPVLTPDPLASALALVLLGGGIAAANGFIPQVSGPVADALSAVGGGVPFS